MQNLRNDKYREVSSVAVSTSK